MVVFFIQAQLRFPHSPGAATRNLPASHPTHGATSALFATRMLWTQCCTRADICVSATPAASNSKTWPTPAAPSAGGKLKTSSRPTAAREECHAYRNNVKAIQVLMWRLCSTTLPGKPLIALYVCSLAQENETTPSAAAGSYRNRKVVLLMACPHLGLFLSGGL